MDRVGIDVAVLSAHAGISSDYRRGNDESLAAADQFPGRLLVYGVVNPNYPSEARAELERCFSHPAVRGIKLHPELHGDHPLDGPGYAAAWEFAAEHGLPVLCHSYFAGDSLRTFGRLAERYPEATVLLGHAGLDLGLEGVVHLTAEHPNVMLDLCGVLVAAGVVEMLTARVGADRLMLGTDMPFNSGVGQWATLLHSDLAHPDLVAMPAPTRRPSMTFPPRPERRRSGMPAPDPASCGPSTPVAHSASAWPRRPWSCRSAPPSSTAPASPWVWTRWSPSTSPEGPPSA